MAELLDTIGPRNGPAPLSIQLSQLGTVDLQSAFAHYDGTSAAGTWVPALMVQAQNGTILGRVFPSTNPAAGDTADVTFFPFVPAASAASPATYAGYVASIFTAAGYSYYKLPEIGAADWADSSGAARTLTYTSRTGELRGQASLPDEGDGELGVYVTGTPGSVAPATYCGSRTGDNFFQFAGTAPFTVIAWVTPDFGTSGGVFSWGICGNVDNNAGAHATDGWSLTVVPTTLQPVLQRRDITGGGGTSNVTAITTLVRGTTTMVAGTYDGATLSIYMNGVLDNTAVSATTLNSASGADMFVGATGINEGFGGTWAPWKGTIGSVIVANGAAAAADLAALYALGIA